MPWWATAWGGGCRSSTRCTTCYSSCPDRSNPFFLPYPLTCGPFPFSFPPSLLYRSPLTCVLLFVSRQVRADPPGRAIPPPSRRANPPAYVLLFVPLQVISFLPPISPHMRAISPPISFPPTIFFPRHMRVAVPFPLSNPSPLTHARAFPHSSHVQFDDDALCKGKYGDKWDEYVRRVPYRIVPFVW